MFFRKQILVAFLIISIAVVSFSGCRSADTEVVYLEEPDPITYPEFYHWAIEQYSSDLIVDPIVDYSDAAEKGQQLWETVLQGYGNKDNNDPVNPGNYIEVFYVPEENAWVICGTSPDYGKPSQFWAWTGIIPIAIIRTDGSVLAVGWI